MRIVLFEDRQVRRLYPITLGRPAYAISCGSFRLIDWLGELGGPASGVVREHLIELQRQDFPQLAEPAGDAAGPVALLNARLVPSAEIIGRARELLGRRQPGLVRYSGSVALAVLPPTAPPLPSEQTPGALEEYMNQGLLGSLPELAGELPLLDYPHEVVRYNPSALLVNLEHRLARGTYREVAEGVFAAEGATIGQYVVTDTRQGPIVLEADASVGPHCYLSGPAHLGRAARVIEYAAIKDGVSLGHTTKIGGEVEASVIEPYTNKQHHGFLGHSYLGSWINLGAGTCNSDLKNTYGEVKMEYDGRKVSTGMQFVGCILGDYSKTAINTGIFTGKTLGTCSMVYGFVTTNVPSFVNYARLFGQVTELPPEVMVATQERMFLRRDVRQRPCDIQLLHDMYELTRHERQLAGEPLAL